MLLFCSGRNALCKSSVQNFKKFYKVCQPEIMSVIGQSDVSMLAKIYFLEQLFDASFCQQHCKIIIC